MITPGQIQRMRNGVHLPRIWYGARRIHDVGPFGGHCWWCDGQGTTGWGFTPAEAYAHWKARKPVQDKSWHDGLLTWLVSLMARARDGAWPYGSLRQRATSNPRTGESKWKANVIK